MATVVAYDIYLEVAENEFCSTWRDNNHMNFWEFRDTLSIQKLTYKSTLRIYPGDENMHVSIQQNRVPRKQGIPPKEDDKTKMTSEKIKMAHHTKYRPGQICVNLSDFQKYVDSKKNVKNPKPCKVCGVPSYILCGLCGESVHCFSQKGGKQKQNCFVDYHCENFFGLKRADMTLVGKRNKIGGHHQRQQQKANKRMIRELLEDEYVSPN
eukprot:5808279-Ditylum_brightwellii.AAC.1